MDVWGDLFPRLPDLASAAVQVQERWDSPISPAPRSATGSIKIADLSFLMDSIGLGGGSWIRQFIYGFGDTG